MWQVCGADSPSLFHVPTGQPHPRAMAGPHVWLVSCQPSSEQLDYLGIAIRAALSTSGHQLRPLLGNQAPAPGQSIPPLRTRGFIPCSLWCRACVAATETVASDSADGKPTLPRSAPVVPRTLTFIHHDRDLPSGGLPGRDGVEHRTLGKTCLGRAASELWDTTMSSALTNSPARTILFIFRFFIMAIEAEPGLENTRLLTLRGFLSKLLCCVTCDVNMIPACWRQPGYAYSRWFSSSSVGAPSMTPSVTSSSL